ncbi:MAG: pyridoxal phosphate-dependent aminotransferase [Candidatus Krumholzibacteriia bacterium]
MPRFPGFAARTGVITGSVFEKFRARMQEQGSNLVGLHIGDAYAPPPYDLPVDAGFLSRHPGFNRYCDTFGITPLREALAEKAQSENALDATPGRVMMTAGACNALSIGMQALVDPGDEVLLPSPYWPFFRGMVRVAGGEAVEVPFYTVLYDDPGLDIAAHLEGHLTAKTVALYLNTPNNPSGKVLDKRQLEQVADFVRANDLWLISDEAYDGMVYDGHEHLSIGALPGMFERTLSVFTFSKVYMFSGLRLGYVVAPESVLANLNKIMVHQLYGPSTLSQQMMVTAVETRKQWSSAFVDHSRELRDMFIRGLAVSPQVPEGAYYLFFSIEDHLRGRDYWQVIDECLAAGVSVAPGEDFGKDFRDYIRICFTGEPPDRLELAVRRLNEIFPG